MCYANRSLYCTVTFQCVIHTVIGQFGYVVSFYKIIICESWHYIGTSIMRCKMVNDQCYIFGKIGRLASDEVIIWWSAGKKNKCIPPIQCFIHWLCAVCALQIVSWLWLWLCLLYGLECYTLPKSSFRSLDFVVVRFLMKLFKTVNNEIIRECCSYFKFSSPSELLDKRRDKFQSNFMLCTGTALFWHQDITC